MEDAGNQSKAAQLKLLVLQFFVYFLFLFKLLFFILKIKSGTRIVSNARIVDRISRMAASQRGPMGKRTVPTVIMIMEGMAEMLNFAMDARSNLVARYTVRRERERWSELN